ncbi:hypothetical protein YIM_08850 [Amycolatopsis sp. YIM 10]|nr:hypothetical protein YIM_08850 [Amycolatopsis sp. YIM 10]
MTTACPTRSLYPPMRTSLPEHMSAARAPLPPGVATEVARWAASAGGKRFCAAARERLRNNGKLASPLRLHGLTDEEWNDIHDLFGREACGRRGEVKLAVADRVLRTGALSIGLRRLLIETGGSIITRSGHARYQRIAKRREVSQARHSLAEAIAGIPELTDELLLLNSLGKEDKFVVPPGTRTGSVHWKPYNSALRVAAVYYQRVDMGKPIPEQSLPTTALDSSKRWSAGSKAAFQNLIGKSLEEAVELRDKPIQMRGPLTWVVDGVTVALAELAMPWICLPLRALLKADIIGARPRGLLLVENHENFEQVCKNTDVPQRWLVIWAEGYTGNLVHRFIGKFPGIPLAAWCDLDPDGIGIIGRAEQATGRTITPIGMGVDLWNTVVADKSPSAEDMEQCRQAVRIVEAVTPPALRDLLECFRHTGARAEQQHCVVYDDVLPTLPTILAALEPGEQATRHFN